LYQKFTEAKLFSEFIIYKKVAEHFVCRGRLFVKIIRGIKNEYAGMSSMK